MQILFVDTRTGENALYYTKLDNTGNTLIEDTLLTYNLTNGYWMAMDDVDNVQITWVDDRDGNDEIYYAKLDNNGSKLVNDTRLTNDNANSWWPRIEVDGNESIHIIWDDNRDGNREIYYKKGAITTGIAANQNNNPTEYFIGQNYPNPFNPTTTINYQIPELSYVTLKVYDVLGSEVTTLVNEEKSTGSYEVEFNASTLPSGIYFYRLQAGSFVETKKMVLLK